MKFNLKELHNKEYLLSIINDKEKLDQIITETKGYVLYVMEKEGLYPELNSLLAKENIFALNFILKNYELTKEQTKPLRKFFSNSVSNKVTNNMLSEEDIKENLVNEVPLSRKTILSIDMLNTYISEINAQFNLDEYNMDEILKNSVNKLTVEQWFLLDRELLLSNYHLFNTKPQFFKNEKFRELFKEIILEVSKTNPNVLNIDPHFENYHFNKNEEGLLRMILKRSFRNYKNTNYGELSRIHGFKEIITKEDFFTNYNNKTIKDFTFAEIETYKPLIQQAFFDRFMSENIRIRNYRGLDKLLEIDCSVEQFQQVITPEFYNKLIENVEKIPRESMSRDDDESKRKNQYLEVLGLNYLVKNKDNENIYKVDIEDSFSNIYRMVDKNKITQEMKEIITKVYKEALPILLKTDFIDLLLKSYSNKIINEYTIELITEIAEENPSINCLALLMKEAKDLNKTSSWKNQEMTKEMHKLIKEMSVKLNKEDVKALSKQFNYDLPLLNFYKNTAPNDYSHNFLNYKNIPFEKIDETIFSMIFFIKDDFRELLLKENKIISKELIYSIINHNDDKKFIKFLRDYFKKNPEQLKDNEIYALIQQSEKAKEILENQVEMNLNVPFQELLHESKIKRELEKEIEIYRKLPQEQRDDKILEAKYEEKSIIENNISSISKALSFDFMENKLEKLIKEKNFEEINLLYAGNYRNHLAKFYQYVNQLDFNTLLKNIDNNDFVNLIISKDYRGKSEIKFSKYTEAENTILAELLLPSMKEPMHIYELFQEDSLGFANEFAIKHMPLEIFYSYNLRPKTKSGNYGDNYIIKPFTNEQILRAFSLIEKSIGFFSYIDANASIDHFFSNNFEERENNFLDLLEKAKSEPKLYTVLAHSHIFRNLIDRNLPENENKLFSDLEMEYFIKHYDLDLILNGCKQIFDEIKENSFKDNYDIKYNKKFALTSIERIIWLTYSDSRADSGDTKYHSILSIEESEKIIKFLFKEAPLFVISKGTIGKYSPLTEEIKNNFDKYVDDSMTVHDLIFSNRDTTGLSVKPGVAIKDDWQNKHANDYLHGLLNYYIENNKEEEINYLSYLVQQNEFFDKEMDYDYKYKLNENTFYTGLLDYLIEDEDLKNKLMISTRKFFLEKALQQKDTVIKKVRKI